MKWLIAVLLSLSLVAAAEDTKPDKTELELEIKNYQMIYDELENVVDTLRIARKRAGHELSAATNDEDRESWKSVMRGADKAIASRIEAMDTVKRIITADQAALLLLEIKTINKKFPAKE